MIIMPKSPDNEMMIVGSTQSQHLIVAEVEEVKLGEEIRVNPHQLHQ